MMRISFLIILIIFINVVLSSVFVVKTDTILINKLICIGEKHLTLDADTSIIVLKNAMSLSSDFKHEAGYLRSGFLLSNIYKQKGLFYDAMKTIDYLLKYAELHKNKELKGKCLYTLGEINRAAFYTDNALNNLFEALSIYKGLKNKQGQAKCYNRISAVYFEKKFMEKSAIYADSSNKIAKQLNLYLLISSNEEILGAVYRRTQRYNQAIKKLESALQWTLLSRDSTDIPNILNNFAYTYLEMKNFDKAIEFAAKSFEMSVNKDILVYTSNAAQILSDCYRAKNKLEKAYNFLRFRDSLSYKSLMNNRNKIIMDLNEKYEAGKKEKQRILLQKDNDFKNITIKNQKYLFLISLFVLVIVSLSTVVVYIGRRKLSRVNKQLKLRKEEISQQHLQISDAFRKLKELETFREDLAGMIVHDLKNPLNTIINPASFQSESQKLESTRLAGLQMLNLVSNILDVQKYESDKMILNIKILPLSQITDNAVEQIILLSNQKNIKINTKVNPQISISADEDIMIRVFVNLLTNAIKYSPNNSEIFLIAEIHSDQVHIKVEDMGEGILPENQNMVFDKFSQVIAKKSGIARSTGLGLSFCKLAVEAHGGTINVASKLRQGSVFTVCMQAILTDNISEKNLKTNQKTIKDISFTDEEKLLIQPIVEQLRKVEIFEVSKIRKILNEIPENPSNSISAWIDKINSAVYSGNDNLFKNLC